VTNNRQAVQWLIVRRFWPPLVTNMLRDRTLELRRMLGPT
jgi:hypothetical protein